METAIWTCGLMDQCIPRIHLQIHHHLFPTLLTSYISQVMVEGVCWVMLNIWKQKQWLQNSREIPY